MKIKRNDKIKKEEKNGQRESSEKGNKEKSNNINILRICKEENNLKKEQR